MIRLCVELSILFSSLNNCKQFLFWNNVFDFIYNSSFILIFCNNDTIVCVGEVINSLDFIQSSMDLNKMSVSLDILCLTLPQPEKPPPSIYPDTINQSPNTNSSNEGQ